MAPKDMTTALADAQSALDRLQTDCDMALKFSLNPSREEMLSRQLADLTTIRRALDLGKEMFDAGFVAGGGTIITDPPTR